MRQTGGMALGETSTRSRPRSRAIFNASNGGRMPICSPFSSITRISRARILSLMRMKDFAERLSSAMIPLLGCGGILSERRLALRVYHWLDAGGLRVGSGDLPLFQFLRRIGTEFHP